ncbi:hypothetical protein [Burkholderia vietnamiensis]|uniref:hypothetical protein n=1 Tax=Burkholderia vietnamiensis TaxID=60552 RepID=UPI001CF5B3A9|nr:hypothetical protein [Burkholderia vietnamiensis]MCA7945600.1 hypothetical protein [Burkholderia vietnamiensis]
MNWTKDQTDARGKWTTPEGFRVFAMSDGSFMLFMPEGSRTKGDTAEILMQHADELAASRA